MLQETKSIHQCWTERDGAPRAALTRSVPEDAMAVIYKPARWAVTSGKARTRDWKLRFEPRSCPFIEPLMGWTGSDDTLAQVELTFPSATAAVAYARRQGLRCYLLQGADRSGHTAGFKREGRQHQFLFARHTVIGRVALATGMGRTDARAEGHSKQVETGTRSCRVLRESQDVLDDHDLSPAQKRDVASVGRRWNRVPDRTGSLQGRTAIRALTFGRGDRTALFDLDETAGRHVSAPDASDGARICEGRAA